MSLDINIRGSPNMNLARSGNWLRQIKINIWPRHIQDLGKPNMNLVVLSIMYHKTFLQSHYFFDQFNHREG